MIDYLLNNSFPNNDKCLDITVKIMDDGDQGIDLNRSFNTLDIDWMLQDGFK